MAPQSLVGRDILDLQRKGTSLEVGVEVTVVLEFAQRELPKCNEAGRVVSVRVLTDKT